MHGQGRQSLAGGRRRPPALRRRSVDCWATLEAAKAAHFFGDEDMATYDYLKIKGGGDPVIAEMFRALEEYYTAGGRSCRRCRHSVWK